MQRQRYKSHQSETSSDDVDDRDRPRSILKPTPSSDFAVRSSRPSFAQGLCDSDTLMMLLFFLLFCHHQMSILLQLLKLLI